MGSIEPEDYEVMKRELKGIKTYDELLNEMLEGIPDKETSLTQFKEFLTTNREFLGKENVII